jgi:hypothetical protein
LKIFQLKLIEFNEIYIGIAQSATGYVPDSIPGRDKIFFLLHSVQTSSGTHPASYPMGTGGSFPGSKAVGA